MTAERLLEGLRRAHARAVAVSNAEDMPREFVNVILPLMPDAAEALLRAKEAAPHYGEEWLMIDHAPLLARHARDLFLSRVGAVALPSSVAEILAHAALGVPPAERGGFRERALAAIARERDLGDRVCALLEWRRAEPDGEAAKFTAQAVALFPALPDGALAQVVSRRGAALGPAERAALLARIEAVREPGVDLQLARCALVAPEERPAIAQAALEQAALKPERREPGYFVPALQAHRLVGLSVTGPWFRRYFEEVETMRSLGFALHEVGADLPGEVLDVADARLRAMDEEAWRLAMTLAELTRHHAARREALREELRPLAERVVGDPVFGHRMQPGEYFEGDDVDALRIAAAMRVSAAFEGGERRAMQHRALALLERADTGVDQRYQVDGLPWGELAAVLDPALYAEAVRVALGIRYRPAALKAVGALVAALPASAHHLALLGLARLADGAPPEKLAAALAALDAAAAGGSTAPPAQRRGHDRAAAAWTAADEVARAGFMAFVELATFPSEAALHAACAKLTPASARRAAAQVLANEHYLWRRSFVAGLASAEVLAGTPEREALVADLLQGDRQPPLRHDVEAIARCLPLVCGEGDAAWAARLSAWFDACAWNIEAFLSAVELLAPMLRRLGGRDTVARLAALLRDPLAPAEVALPWAQAAVGSFEA